MPAFHKKSGKKFPIGGHEKFKVSIINASACGSMVIQGPAGETREAANILQNFLKRDEENERADPIYSFDSFG